MMRRVLLVAVLLLGLPLAARAQTGQGIQVYYDLQGDSVVAAASGAAFSVVLVSYDPYGWGVDSFAVRIPFDATRLAFLGATKLCPDSTPLNATPGAGFVIVSAPSCGAYPYGQPLARLTFQLQPGVTDGTVLGMRPLALIDNGTQNRTLDFITDFLQVCHASGVWGDIDLDTRVNSRDALIALSNAVGMPTGGFNVAPGDVDADGQVTSRDALAMLSASINLSTSGFRVGSGIADACARQTVLPRPLYFVRDGAQPGLNGVSGLAIRAANDSSMTIPGDSADIATIQWRPRVSPDGSEVLFVCANDFGWFNICKASADGSNKVVLTNVIRTEYSPDWSPAGDSIVFVTGGSVWMMDAAGQGQRLVPGPAGAAHVTWKPGVGNRTIAYIDANGNGSIHTLDLDTGLDVLLFDAGAIGTFGPRYIDWNLAGDSLLFDFQLDLQYAIGAVSATPGPLDVRLHLISGAYHPLWTDQGVVFVGYYHGYYRLLLARPDGTIGIISHDTQHHYTAGMKRQ